MQSGAHPVSPLYYKMWVTICRASYHGCRVWQSLLVRLFKVCLKAGRVATDSGGEYVLDTRCACFQSVAVTAQQSSPLAVSQLAAVDVEGMVRASHLRATCNSGGRSCGRRMLLRMRCVCGSVHRCDTPHIPRSSPAQRVLRGPAAWCESSETRQGVLLLACSGCLRCRFAVVQTLWLLSQLCQRLRGVGNTVPTTSCSAAHAGVCIDEGDGGSVGWSVGLCVGWSRRGVHWRQDGWLVGSS